MSEEDEKKVVELGQKLTAELGEHLLDSTDEFWDSKLNLPEEFDSNCVDSATNGAVLLFAAQVLRATGATKEEWLGFCESVYEELDFDAVQLTSLKVGDA